MGVLMLLALSLTDFGGEARQMEVPAAPQEAAPQEAAAAMRLFSVPATVDERQYELHVHRGDDASGFNVSAARFCADRGLAALACGEELIAALAAAVRYHWEGAWLPLRAVEAARPPELGLPGGGGAARGGRCAALGALFCLPVGVSGSAYEVAVRDGASGDDVLAFIAARHEMLGGLGSNPAPTFARAARRALWARWRDTRRRMEEARRGALLFWLSVDAASGNVVDLPGPPPWLDDDGDEGDEGGEGGEGGGRRFRLVPRVAADPLARGGGGLRALRFHALDSPHERAREWMAKLYGGGDGSGGDGSGGHGSGDGGDGGGGPRRATYENLLEALLERYYGAVRPLPRAGLGGGEAVPDVSAAPASAAAVRFVLLTIAVGHAAGRYAPAAIARGFELPLASKRAYCADPSRRCAAVLHTTLDFEPGDYPPSWGAAAAGARHAMYRKPGHNAAFFQKPKAALGQLLLLQRRHAPPRELPPPALGDEWVFVTDLDTLVANPNASLAAYVPPEGGGGGGSGGSYSVVLADREEGFPNSGCWMVRNSAFGRAFLRRWAALERTPWLTNDNGALAYLVLETTHEARRAEAAADEAAGGRADEAAAAAAVAARLESYRRLGNLGYADYRQEMELMGAPFGARRHPHIRFLSEAASRRDPTGSPRPFCARWHWGTPAAGAGGGAAPRSALAESAYQPCDLLVHNKWWLGSIARAIEAQQQGATRRSLSCPLQP